MSRPSLSSLPTGCTLLRFEGADGLTHNVDDDEARRRIGFGDTKFRAMPGGINGDLVEPYLYAVFRIDQHRFVWDLPRSVTSLGATSAGTREGTLHTREGGRNSPPVGRVFFMTTDRRFAESDPSDRRDFEAMR